MMARRGSRDGKPVLEARCTGCGEWKVRSLDRTRSEFAFNGRKNGRRRWKSKCKVCQAAAQKEYREGQQREFYLRRRRERYHELMRDEAYAERLRVYAREQKRAKARDAEWVERTREQQRLWKRNRSPEQRARARETYRLWNAERRLRQGLTVAPRPIGHPSRLPVDPFREWLKEYRRVTGAWSSFELAKELEIGDHRIRVVIRRDHERVTEDIVDTALLHAVPIYVPRLARMVVTLDDLYPLGGVA